MVAFELTIRAYRFFINLIEEKKYCDLYRKLITTLLLLINFLAYISAPHVATQSNVLSVFNSLSLAD